MKNSTSISLTLLLGLATCTQAFAYTSKPLAKEWSYNMTGEQVRDLQVRLRHAKALATYDTSSRFGMLTKAAVSAFQKQYDLPETGKVDQLTWDILLENTPEPTQAEINNRDVGAWFVRPEEDVYIMEVQHRLRQMHLYKGDINGDLNDKTRAAIRAFRTDAGLPGSDVLDERAWSQLITKTYSPSYGQLFSKPPVTATMQDLDPRCTVGKVVCISKQQGRLSYVVDGDIKLTRQARFAMPGYESPEGDFKVWYKNWNTVSSIFGERMPMPYAIFYDENVAIHFSDDFVLNGYTTGSHGCTQLDDYKAAKWLYEHVKVGDRVVVY